MKRRKLALLFIIVVIALAPAFWCGCTGEGGPRDPCTNLDIGAIYVK